MFRFEKVAFRDILTIEQLTIHQGEITCIIGESGSGKTTLLRMLNHLQSPDQGKIFFNGEDLQDLEPVKLRRRVIMLPQTPVIFKGSVRDNLIIGRRFSEKETPPEEVLEDLLTKVKLSKKLNDSAEKLSGGEKQRLALGRILLMEPEVLLLDEPSSALDDETENILIETFVNYTKKHEKTLIMITHSKALAEKFGDRILQVKGGTVYEWNH